MVLFILLIILEKGFFNFLKRWEEIPALICGEPSLKNIMIFRKGAPVVDSQNEKDSDVIAEREKIKNLSEESGKNYGLLLK